MNFKGLILCLGLLAGVVAPATAQYENYKREFGIRISLKKLNRQLEKVTDSFGNFDDF